MAEFHSLPAWLESGAYRESKRSAVTGLKGSSKALLLSLWTERKKGKVLVITAHQRDAEYLLEDFRFFDRRPNEAAILFPQWETLPYDEIPPHPEIIRKRVHALFRLMEEEDLVVFSPVKALLQKVLTPSDLRSTTFILKRGEEVDRDRLVQFFGEAGYTPVSVVEERGDFSVRGAIVDCFSPLYEEPLRFEFDGDRLESIRRFDVESQRSLKGTEVETATLLPARDLSKILSQGTAASLFDYLRRGGWVFIVEGDEVMSEAESYTRMVEAHYEKARLKKATVPFPEDLYLPSEEFRQRLEAFKVISLQEGPIAPLGFDRIDSIDFEGNEDLQREVRSFFETGRARPKESPLSVLLSPLRQWLKEGRRVFLVSHTPNQAERMAELLSHYEIPSRIELEKRFHEVSEEQGMVHLLTGRLSRGFRTKGEGWVLLTEEEIFGERRRYKEERGGRRFLKGEVGALSSFSELRENDFVVHTDYGIGIYRGLKHLKIGLSSNDYLLLEYQDADKVYVPVDRLNLIQRYIGGDGSRPRLDKLGGRSWQRAKKRAKEAVTEMVKELLDLYAAREAFTGTAFSPVDASYKEFEATFEYEETPDQLKAIEEVMADMGRPKPMDRLICGDVGFGKTEVALRAAYRAVMDGKQVAFLVPTTVLAQQHYQTFSSRFRNVPVVIEMLSRFKSPGEQKEILKRLGEGKIDIIIGTHRLLQKDVAFQDLGLVVIDEEHRFGVDHKERLKQMRKTVDVITLTATPIPRTLQMAISGIRDLSLIQTPPENRLSIRTFVVRYDDEVIREAILREFDRGGQVFFVHHRVQNIYSMAAHLKALVPEARLAVAHGQMRERELEKVMLRFVRGEHNLLVCTSIIESGLDIPAANTILINHAEQFGLADLYQLRGRVGRGRHQAYAYLLIPSDLALSRDAARRFQALQELSDLGSGFKLALHDLEIRGAGNLLGRAQSGHISAVGLEYYTQLMERAVKELRGEEVVEEITPEIQFHLPAFIPERYVADPEERLRFYRRLSHCRTEEAVEAIRDELLDRYGPIPEETLHLIDVIKVKILLTRLSIRKFEETPSRMVLAFDPSTTVSPQKVIEMVKEGNRKVRLTPDGRLVVEGWSALHPNPFEAAKRLLQRLV
ncbi:MAG: transcription-repair coupling factor [Desulfobacterota bacterium]|nr:transcription-repair coupling factor [Thermodesulfobacteriota bacterium]